MHGSKIDIGERKYASEVTPFFDFDRTPATPAERLLVLAGADRKRGRWSASEELAGRVIDATLAFVLIIVLLPFLALLAATIKIVDPGPVVFAHRRVGRNGRQFNCYKFRSMRVGAEAEIATLLATSPALRAEWERDQKFVNDPRVSRLGRILRSTSLDELPQLYNVLVGDMSLVGPRPIVSSELSRYGNHAGTYLSVRPGVTGLWQVSRCEDTSYRRRVAMDVLYVKRKSLALDLTILVATVPAVVRGKGAY